MTEVLDGRAYRVKARHPRRPGTLRITTSEGRVVACSGETCERASAADLASMIANGYVERIEMTAPSRARLVRRDDLRGGE